MKREGACTNENKPLQKKRKKKKHYEVKVKSIQCFLFPVGGVGVFAC